jgi:hypothetical protein
VPTRVGTAAFPVRPDFDPSPRGATQRGAVVDSTTAPCSTTGRPPASVQIKGILIVETELLVLLLFT